MKEKLLGIGLGVLLIGLTLPAFIMVLNRGTSVEESAADAPEFMGIPLYPGSQQTYSSTEDKELPADHRLARPGAGAQSFRTSDSIDQVDAFYTERLPEQGWLLWEAENLDPIMRGSVFILNASETNPYRTRLLVLLRVFTEGETNIELELERWPDPEKVPIYPGAQDVQINETKQLGSTLLERSIVYVCDGAPTEIEMYYKEQLTEHGWLLAFDSQYRPGPGFHYGRGGNHGTMGSSVWVNVTAEGEGRTKVELTVSIMGSNK